MEFQMGKISLNLGDVFPDFSAVTDKGRIESFHDWTDGNWSILFSHPADFTPVCTTELARAAQLASEFAGRKVRMLALSCDSAESHREWIKDIVAYGKLDVDEKSFPFEIIADEDQRLATDLGMLDPMETNREGLPLPARAVFIIGPEFTLRAKILYPATTGRSFDEILRVIDSMQMTDKHKVATPEGWTQGCSCMIQPSVTDKDAQSTYGDSIKFADLPSGKKYIRSVPQP